MQIIVCAVVNFANIFRAISLRQRGTNLKCKYNKAACKTFARKICSQFNVGEIDTRLLSSYMPYKYFCSHWQKFFDILQPEDKNTKFFLHLFGHLLDYIANLIRNKVKKENNVYVTEND